MTCQQDEDSRVGVLTRHCDGEDGATVGWEFNLGGGRRVWVGEMSKRSFKELDPEHRSAMRNDFGWFIVLYGADNYRVLGKAVDEWAAMELAELLGRALQAQDGGAT